MRARRAWLGPLVLVLVTAAAGGCARTEDGTAIAQLAHMPASGSPTPGGSGAPVVSDPLSVAPFLPDPCALISTPRLAALELPAAGVPDVDGPGARLSGPSCSWLNADTLSAVTIAVLVKNENGLGDIYRGHREGRLTAYFEETTVAGYPGVFTDTADFRSIGTCTVMFGLDDSTALMATERGRLGMRSCDRAKDAAVAVVETVKEAS